MHSSRPGGDGLGGRLWSVFFFFNKVVWFSFEKMFEYFFFVLFIVCFYMFYGFCMFFVLFLNDSVLFSNVSCFCFVFRGLV